MTPSTRVSWICSTFPDFQVSPASGGATTNVGFGANADFEAILIGMRRL
jgi:hypothetical protein